MVIQRAMSSGRNAFNGMAYAVIRAGQSKGELKLTVTSSDNTLTNASVTIQVG